MIKVIPTMQKTSRHERRKSTSQYTRILLEGAPAMFKSSTQKSVTLSVCEAEQRADSWSIMCSRHDLRLECSGINGTQGEAPLIIEMDNKGDVDLANNWNILVVLTGMSMCYIIQVSCENLRSPK